MLPEPCDAHHLSVQDPGSHRGTLPPEDTERAPRQHELHLCQRSVREESSHHPCRVPDPGHQEDVRLLFPRRGKGDVLDSRAMYMVTLGVSSPSYDGKGANTMIPV